MRLLAFDTSTDRMSVALSAGMGSQARTWGHDAAGGALASSALLPAIQSLMAQAGLRFADLDGIVFGRGPGAFTGLRTACAVAQGLAYGAQAERAGRSLPVLPVDTLLAVAEEARFRHAPEGASFDVHALLDARMDQVYGAGWHYANERWSSVTDTVLDTPARLAAPADCVLAGNVFEVYAAQLSASIHARVACLPTAHALLRLAPGLFEAGGAVAPQDALPLYIRDKVAQTTLERADARRLSSKPPAS